MFSCTRNASVLLTGAHHVWSIPAESSTGHLLFLYPPWYRSSLRRSQHAAAAARVGHGILAKGTCLELPPPPYADRLANASDRTARFVKYDWEPNRIRVDTARAAPVTQQPKGHPAPLSPLPVSSLNTRSNIAVYADKANEPSIQDGVDERKARRWRRVLDQSKTRQDEDKELVHHVQMYSAGSREATRKRSPAEAQAARSNRMHTIVDLLSNKLEKNRSPRLDQIQVKEEILFEIIGGFGEAIWKHLSCEVHMLPKNANDPPGKRTVNLRGTTSARSITRTYLEGLSLSEALKDGDEKLFRTRYSQRKQPVRHQRTCRADNVPKPEHWSIRSFADYVEDITLMRVSWVRRRQLYSPHESHNEVVARCLDKVFGDPDLVPYLSTRALRYALRFACQHTNISILVHRLLAAARNADLRLTPDTFGILLDANLTKDDATGLSTILSGIGAQEFVTGEGIWAEALRNATSNKETRRILSIMLNNKFTESSKAKTEIVIAMMRLRASYLRPDLEAFRKLEESMNEKLGPRWLNVTVINRMLVICISRKMFDVATTVVQFALNREVPLKPSTLSLIFSLFERSRSPEQALELFCSYLAEAVGIDEVIVVSTLFKTAWRAHLYNVCRVLWHYAASHGIISREMQELVNTWLIRNVQMRPDDGQPPRRLAAKIIAGTDLSMTDLKSTLPILAERCGSTSDPISILSAWTPNDGTRDEQLSLAYAIMHRDLNAFKTWQPMARSDFTTLLQEAFGKDRDWHARDLVRGDNLETILKERIAIQLIPRSQHSGSQHSNRDPNDRRTEAS